MAKAVYRRYAVEESIYYEMVTQEISTKTERGPDAMWSDYNFDTSTGVFKTTGEYYTSAQEMKGKRGYLAFGKTMNIYSQLYISGTYVYVEAGCRTKVVSQEALAYLKGAYLNDVILDYGSVPNGSRASDGYWYEFVRMVGMSGQAGGVFRDLEGFAHANGLWKPQAEIKANVAGAFK